MYTVQSCCIALSCTTLFSLYAFQLNTLIGFVMTHLRHLFYRFRYFSTSRIPLVYQRITIARACTIVETTDFHSDNVPRNEIFFSTVRVFVTYLNAFRITRCLIHIQSLNEKLFVVINKCVLLLMSETISEAGIVVIMWKKNDDHKLIKHNIQIF